MEILIKTVQLLFSLTILVFIHELGHFLSAKACKARVEKFYLFFDPWFSIFKFKKGDTEYGIGWLPLGGYTKISGMIDESMDTEQMKQPAQPWEFRAKPAWQRLIIMVAGVIMNIVLAIGIYIATLAIWGEQYLPTSEVKYGIAVDSLGYELGLRNGDKIISIDNAVVEDFSKIPSHILLEKARTIQVERDGKPAEVVIPEGFLSKMIKSQSADFISVRIPFEVDDFAKSSPAKAAGLKKGDKIIGIDTLSTPYFDMFRAEIQKHKNQEVTVVALRENDTVRIRVKVPEKGLIGVAPKPPVTYFNLSERHYNAFQAIPAGFVKTWKGIDNYWKQLKLIFSKDVKAYESVGGFITIGKIFPATWDWESFWALTAFLSIMLAILNILPIPALDGGHVLFVLVEIITGRKPSDKFLEYAQIVGMVLLFGLLILANGNDIIRLFR
ncbi:MAG TPA: RIP metalloprotease RseP [Bacteroidales bacterium]|nr:RIP metalloprotease RseP [Bacteroidales bacterium]HPT02657.1 RIP metalloprotease RseP [Bacteroidales bacterium]